MREWKGSAAICFNEKNEILMVRANDIEGWAIPSGGIEEGETSEECCIREVKEETGYDVKLIEKIFIKETVIKDIEVKTFYFIVEKINESEGINDPDNTIDEARWMSASELKNITHVYPEDLEMFQTILDQREQGLKIIV